MRDVFLTISPAARVLVAVTILWLAGFLMSRVTKVLKVYQIRVAHNAQVLAEALKKQGFDLVSGGTDNHLALIDLRKAGVTGKELQRRLDEVYITANKNAIPNDPEGPFVTSGMRVGTPAVTTRGFGEPEMVRIAQFIWQAATDFEAKADEIRQSVREMVAQFPIYFG